MLDNESVLRSKTYLTVNLGTCYFLECLTRISLGEIHHASDTDGLDRCLRIIGTCGGHMVVVSVASRSGVNSVHLYTRPLDVGNGVLGQVVIIPRSKFTIDRM